MCKNWKGKCKGESVGEIRKTGRQDQTWRTLYGHVFVLRSLDFLWEANEEGNDIIIFKLKRLLLMATCRKMVT